eukprot:263569-Chlamydomonas_euryale.AAC.2
MQRLRHGLAPLQRTAPPRRARRRRRRCRHARSARWPAVRAHAGTRPPPPAPRHLCIVRARLRSHHEHLGSDAPALRTHPAACRGRRHAG